MLARSTVISAVTEYGAAWTTQDADRIAALFTEDAVYVERAFDRNGTFVGREQIREYWLRQICGKQTSIRFRHVERDLVIDATRPVAVVKWLAEFDNFREKRADKAEKLVRFCQVARLEFAASRSATSKHGRPGPGARWPLGASEDELAARTASAFRESAVAATCDKCQTLRLALEAFAHLRATPCGEGALARRWSRRPRCASPSATTRRRVYKRCCTTLWVNTATSTGPRPPRRARGHVQPRRDQCAGERVDLPALGAGCGRDCRTSTSRGGRRRSALRGERRQAGGTSRRAVAAAARRPWLPVPRADGVRGARRRPTPFASLEAARYVDEATLRRMAHAARRAVELKDAGWLKTAKLGRVRCSAQDAPRAAWCRVSISMRQPEPLFVNTLVAVLVAHARGVLDGAALTRGLKARPSETGAAAATPSSGP